jgi:hypothetical protein
MSRNSYKPSYFSSCSAGLILPLGTQFNFTLPYEQASILLSLSETVSNLLLACLKGELNHLIPSYLCHNVAKLFH